MSVDWSILSDDQCWICHAGLSCFLFNSKFPIDRLILQASVLPAAAGSSGQAVINAFPCYPKGNDEFSRENLFGKWQANLNEKKTALDQQEAKLTEQKTTQDQREAKLTEQKTGLNLREARLTKQKIEQDLREANLTKLKTELDQWRAKLTEQKTSQDQREAKLIGQKATQDQRETKLIKQKTEQDQRETKLIEQKAALDKREAEMGQPRVEPDDHALQAKKRNRETDLEFLIKTATSIAQVEWLADDEMKQDIKAKIRKLTNPE